ncbi:Uma2 family endonuclease [Gammaproteobacteria bacterium]
MSVIATPTPMPKIVPRHRVAITYPTPEMVYPDSDGNPMADNTLQFEIITTLHGNLTELFSDRKDVFVAGDLLWYPVEGDNSIRAAPDVMVAFGRPPGYRGSYKQWCEGRIAPQVVFEILSPGNRAGEMSAKFYFYQKYGVEEYYVHDPDRGLLNGWLRRADQLVEIPKMEGWVSPRLGIRFHLDGTTLVVYHPDGNRFETFLKVKKLAKEHLEIERQLTEAERQRATHAEQRAESEHQRAESEHQRAEAEHQRAQRLAERLQALGIDPDA